MSDSNPTSSNGPELIIGLAGAIGTKLEWVTTALEDALSQVGYRISLIRISQLMHEIQKTPWSDLQSLGRHEDDRYHMHMDAGNELRKILGRGDALALLAMGAIREERKRIAGDYNSPIPRRAYILRSLKHHEEVKTLRRIYGQSFLLVSAYSRRDQRVDDLSTRIADSRNVFQSVQYRHHAEKLILRDEKEADNKFGQSLRDTYPLADVFVDTADQEELKESVRRYVEVIFGHPFHTPNRHECGMMHAQTAALRSGALGRQVGAAITTKDGDVVAVGTNEVAKSGGGLYWDGDKPDNRDHVLGYDSNDNLKRRLFGDILQRLQDKRWLSEEYIGIDISSLINKAFGKDSDALLKGAQLLGIIEFGRCVHAEMAAITDAARRGVSVGGAELYTSTFPCHECARHIVSSGITKVYYIEPYPKSLVPELYPDSVAIESTTPDHVCFTPFIGIAPRNYLSLFSMVDRKEDDGRIVDWDRIKTTAIPRFTNLLPPAETILAGENAFFAQFQNLMERHELWRDSNSDVLTNAQGEPSPEILEPPDPDHA
jgi:cytidine deaminase